ncbi:MAG: prephenate dehydrogenase [Caldilineaceae bacterium]
MAKARITIIGLGETGASIGLALLKEPGDFEVVGHDRNTDAEAEAKRLGAVHRTEWNLHTAVEGASLVVLAMPLHAIIETFGHIVDDLAPEALVFAINPLLQPVTEAAARLLPNHKRVVAGHPIRLEPPATPSADTLLHVTFCLAASAHAEPASVELASDLIERVGASPHFVDVAEHDGIMAAVEQLPQLLGAALISLNTGASGWREMRQLAGRRFGQAGTLLGDPKAAATSFALNREAILLRIDALQRELDKWRSLIAEAETPVLPVPTGDGPPARNAAPSQVPPLLDALKRIDEEQALWQKQATSQRWDTETENPGAGGSGLLRQLFLGNIGRKKPTDNRSTRT